MFVRAKYPPLALACVLCGLVLAFCTTPALCEDVAATDEPEQIEGSSNAQVENEPTSNVEVEHARDSQSDNGTADTQLTREDVQQIVSDAVTSSQSVDDAAYSQLANSVSELGDTVRLLAANEEQTSEDLQVVRIDPSQADTAKAAVRLAVTEGLITVLLLACIAGLVGWQIVSEGWRK